MYSLFISPLLFVIDNISVVNQYYEAEVVSEYVIKGNTAVLKCTIPSFVGDFVKVEAWLSSEGTQFLPTDNFGINTHIINIFYTDINRISYNVKYIYYGGALLTANYPIPETFHFIITLSKSYTLKFFLYFALYFCKYTTF